MADFQQSAASRQAMSDAARAALYNRITTGPAKALAGALGVTPRTVERWRAFINKSGAQQRNPEKALPKVAGLAGSVTLAFSGAVDVGGNPKYSRQLDTQVEVPAETLSQALARPDDAWEAFFDAYVFPGGTVEDIDSLSFI